MIDRVAMKERAVVGTMVADCPATWPPAIESLFRNLPESLDDLRLGKVATAIRERHLAGQPVYPAAIHVEDIDDGFVRSLAGESVPLEEAEALSAELLKAFQSRKRASVLRDAADDLASKPERADAIAAHVVRCLSELDKEQKPPRRFTIRRPSEVLGMTFDDSDCIVGDHVIAKFQCTTILGAGGLGKSRFILQLAASCLSGLSFPGLVTNGLGMRWLILQGENSNRRLHADFKALRNWAGDRWPLIDEGLLIHTVETDDDGFLTLSSADTVSAIADAIGEHEPDLIVFDPLKDFAIGDLNTDRDMAESCRAISQLSRKGNPGRAIVVLHHALTGKAAAGRAVGYERSSFGRNSKLLQAWTRAQVNVAPGSGESNDLLVISSGKCSNGREFAPYAVRLNPQTMLYELVPDFDFAAWEADTAGKAVTVELTNDRVASLCVGAMTKKSLVAAIMEETGVGRTKAYAAVEKAEKSKRIHLHPVTKTYVRKK
jgi:hypothetical protein